MIDREHVLHIARLARLRLTDEDVEQFSHQLGSILDYVEQLDSAPTEGVNPTSVMARELESMREDEPVPSLDRNALLQNGPLIREDHFAVPKVIGG